MTTSPIDTTGSITQNEAAVSKRFKRRNWTNTGQIERWVSAIGGTALVGFGLVWHGWPRIALASVGGALVVRGVSGHSFLYQALGVETTGQPKQASTSVSHNQGIKIVRAVTIQKSPKKLYRYWRNFENLPRIMSHLESVTMIDATRSHWVAKAPAGQKVAWDAVIINDKENELIAWRSLEGADIPNAGSVHFQHAPGNRGTIVKVELEYKPPAGKAGSLIAKIFGEEPDQQVREDLRHFKEMMEAGEIPTTSGQPSGRSK